MRNSVFIQKSSIFLIKVVLIATSITSEVSASSFHARRLLSSKSLNQNGINGTDELFKTAGAFSSRALWVRKGKLVFPTGTIIVLTPQITIPAFRKKPFNGGLNSDLQLSVPLYMNLEKMGYTDDMHPYPFDIPPFWPFGPMRRPIGDKTTPKPDPMKMMMMMHMHGPPMVAQSAPSKMKDEDYKDFKGAGDGTTGFKNVPIYKRAGSGGHVRKRNPRSIMALPPPESLHGGDRAMLLPKIEEMLGNVGFEGRGCMLRAICEIHEFPLQEGYGMFGDLISWFFSVSPSPYAESHMPEYLKAEMDGRDGNCNEYKNVCSKSLFKWEMERKPYHNEL